MGNLNQPDRVRRTFAELLVLDARLGEVRPGLADADPADAGTLAEWGEELLGRLEDQ